MARRKAKRDENRFLTDERKLYLRVTSPRIVFYQCAAILKRIFKLLLVLGVIGGAGYYLTQSITKHLNTNEKFVLRHLDFESNGHMSAEEAAQIAGINLSESIFKVDIDVAEQRLRELPEVVSAEVERRLYDTIKVRVVERVPVAWVESSILKLKGRSQKEGLLIDEKGGLFLCGDSLWTVAQGLPVIVVKKADPDEFPLGAEMLHKDGKRALDLVNRVQQVPEKDWALDRVEVLNFYSLKATSNDGVEATFGMYEHERQLEDLLAARRHARETGRKLDWINLLPEHNIPGGFKVPKAVPVDGVSEEND